MTGLPTGPRRRRPRRAKNDDGWRKFSAEAAYADSIFRGAIGDVTGSIEAAERALKILPTYAPAILSVGSIAYQRRQKKRGRRLFHSLLELPDGTEDLAQIIDEAGDFLIGRHEHADGFELYSRAVERFPDVAALRQGVGCCAGHLGRYDEAVAASQRAVELDPTSQKAVNDLGWSLYEAGRMDEARVTLERAVAMDPSDELAAENLRICEAAATSGGRSDGGQRARSKKMSALKTRGEPDPNPTTPTRTRRPGRASRDGNESPGGGGTRPPRPRTMSKASRSRRRSTRTRPST
ncbi:MAG: tetratricopeptide repeat protein [Deltaproteobacteria bacterium]|nr:tetratricopeptide repeat protein [Deltaproteobacteria bacterium]